MKHASIRTHGFRNPAYLLLHGPSMAMKHDFHDLNEDLGRANAKFLVTVMTTDQDTTNTFLLRARTPRQPSNWVIIAGVEALMFVLKYSDCVRAHLNQEEMVAAFELLNPLRSPRERMETLIQLYETDDAVTVRLIYSRLEYIKKNRAWGSV